jgi:hypothetical protein
MKEQSKLKPLIDFKLTDKIYDTEEMFRSENILATRIPQQRQSTTSNPSPTDVDQQLEDLLENLITFVYSTWKMFDIYDNFLYICEMELNKLNALNDLPSFDINTDPKINFVRHSVLLKKYSELQSDTRSKKLDFELILIQMHHKTQHVDDSLFTTIRNYIEQVANNNHLLKELEAREELEKLKELNMIEDLISLVKSNSYNLRAQHYYNCEAWLKLMIANDEALKNILMADDNSKEEKIRSYSTFGDEQILELQNFNARKFTNLTEYNNKKLVNLKGFKHSHMLITFIAEIEMQNAEMIQNITNYFNKEIEDWKKLREYNIRQLSQLRTFDSTQWENFNFIIDNTADISQITLETQTNLYQINKFWHDSNPEIQQTLTYQVFLAMRHYETIKKIDDSIYDKNPTLDYYLIRSFDKTKEIKNPRIKTHLSSVMKTATMRPSYKLSSIRNSNNFHNISAAKDLSMLISLNHKYSQSLIFHTYHFHHIGDYMNNLGKLESLQLFNPEDNIDAFYKKHTDLLNKCLTEQKQLLHLQKHYETTTSLIDVLNKKTSNLLTKYSEQELERMKETRKPDSLFFRDFMKSVEQIFDHWQQLHHYNYEKWLQLSLYHNIQFQNILMTDNADERNQKISSYLQKTNEFIINIKKHNEEQWQIIQRFTNQIEKNLQEYKAKNLNRSKQYEEWLKEIQNNNNNMWINLDIHYSNELKQWSFLQENNHEQFLKLQTIDVNQWQQWRSLISPINANDTPHIRAQNFYNLFKSWHENNQTINPVLIYQIFIAMQCYAVIKENNEVMDLVSSHILINLASRYAVIDSPLSRVFNAVSIKSSQNAPPADDHLSETSVAPRGDLHQKTMKTFTPPQAAGADKPKDKPLKRVTSRPIRNPVQPNGSDSQTDKEGVSQKRKHVGSVIGNRKNNQNQHSK